MLKHELPQLPYLYDALEPYIDARTMEIHHGKHHAAYVNKLNEALANYPELQEKSIEELILSLDSIPESIRTAVRNMGGGHLNHSFFWKIMKPPNPPVGGSDGEPKGKIIEAINDSFGGFQNFKEEFTKIASMFFGSGWVWLALDEKGKAAIVTTPDHLNPIMKNQKPLLVVDVWEHAYYIKYQNRRPEYIDAWWNVVNWAEAEKNLEKVRV